MRTLSRRVGPDRAARRRAHPGDRLQQQLEAGVDRHDHRGGGSGGKVTLRLGYLPNVTHAPAIIGLQNGTFANDLGVERRRSRRAPTTRAPTRPPRSSPARSTPRSSARTRRSTPTRSRTARSIRIVVGRRVGRRVPRREAVDHERRPTSRARSSRRRRSATPRTSRCAPGSKSKGSRPTTDRRRRRHDRPAGQLARRVTAFQTGAIDGAWVPEPYATQLAAGGRQGPRRRGDPLAEGPVRHHEPRRDHEVPRRPPRRRRRTCSRASTSSIDLIKSNPTQAEQLVSTGIGAVNGQGARRSRSSRRRSRASRSRSTRSPRRCKKDAAHAKALGFIDSTDLTNIYDLTLLNKLLTAQGKPAITP